MAKNKWINFGALIELREEKQTEDQKYYISLDQNLELAINGEDYDKPSLTVKTNTNEKYDYIRFDVFAGNLKIGSILENKEGTGFYFGKDQNVELYFNGDKFNGKYISMDRPIDKLNFFLENDHISQEKYDKRVANLKEYIKYEFAAKL